jgi:alginate O-acetyltransferase complex protein AlgI
MAFSSNFFLFAFLPVTIALHYVARPGYRNYVLLFVSVMFYAFDTGWLAWLLIASILFNYVAARLIAEADGRWRHAFLVAGVGVNLLPLLHYKYTAFLWGIGAPLLSSIGLRLGAAPVVDLPIGISFFTFQAISYLADVYTRTVSPALRLVDFGAYHSMFPQLIAGPIVRYVEVEAEVQARRWNIDRAADGVLRFCLGLGKKIILADTMGAVVDPVFALPANELSFGVAWLAVLCYTLQIYYDFSGYSDMAIGLGKLLGFDFPENFNQPYRSRNITEFWRRWHMTLSRWFRDYVYFPLGGNRAGAAATYRNLFIVFFLCGLWHGAGYTFIVWGLYQGGLLVAERLYRNHVGPLPDGPLAWVCAFLLIMIGWVFFRSTNLGQAGLFLATMFGLVRPEMVYYGLPYFLTAHAAFMMAVGLALAFIPFEELSWRMEGPPLAFFSKAVGALLIFAYGVLMLSANSFNPFIYFRF